MKRKIFVMLIFVCFLGLAACGKENTQETVPVSETQSAPTEMSTVETTAETELEEEAKSTAFYSGTWTVSRLSVQEKEFTMEEWVKFDPDTEFQDTRLVFQESGKCQIGDAVYAWEPTAGGVKIGNAALPLEGEEIVVKSDDATVYFHKVSDEQTFAEKPVEEPTETTAEGLRPEFKEAMDAYEDFYNEYFEILEKYSKNPTDVSILTKYLSMLSKMNDVDKAFQAWDSSDLNAEELKYYLDLTARISKRLLDFV